MNESILARLGHIIKSSVNAISSLSFASVFKTFTIMLFLLVLLCIYNIIQAGTVVNIVERKLNDIQIQSTSTETDVAQSIQQRIDVSPSINNEMTQLLYKLGAARVCVTEFHNSIANMSGLHFQMFSMTYEIINPDIPSVSYISQQYQSQNTSLYNVPSYVCTHEYLNADTQSLMKIDRRWATIAQLDGVKREAIYVMRDLHGVPVGMLSATWYDEPTNVSSIRGEMLAAALRISSYLSYKHSDIEQPLEAL